MHMADALVSPAVGGVFWAASAAVGVYCVRGMRERTDEGMLPLMGVAGAFVFAAQMINFTIPGTGSSGHIGGGMLLAVLLGPHAAFLAIASVLTIQALFFADGGLLALGCNVFNLGIFPSFIAYPFVYRAITGPAVSRGRLTTASVAGAIVSLQMGAFAVVMQTLFSGVSGLPFTTFVLLMQPIHLAIGVVEGLVTAAVLLYVHEVRPELLAAPTSASRRLNGVSIRRVVTGLLVCTVIIGVSLSWFASTRPDGLEWSIGRTSGVETAEAPETAVHSALESLQEKLAFLPDYAFRNADAGAADSVWPSPSAGTSVSGLVGSAITLAVVFLVALAFRRRKPPVVRPGGDAG